MFKIVPSGQFRKDLKRAKKRGADLILLQEVVSTLAAGKKLDPEYRDHSLSGVYKDFENATSVRTGF